MNKAFVREPEDDGRAYCPRCRSLGVPVEVGPLDSHIRAESRAKLRDDAWFCNFPRCDVAYFNQFDAVVTVDELTRRFTRRTRRAALRVLRLYLRRGGRRRQRWHADAHPRTLGEIEIAGSPLQNRWPPTAAAA